MRVISFALSGRRREYHEKGSQRPPNDQAEEATWRLPIVCTPTGENGAV
jgi:hypothetical protein